MSHSDQVEKFVLDEALHGPWKFKSTTKNADKNSYNDS